MHPDLSTFRMESALRSAGTSRSDIKSMVLRLLDEHNVKGRLLDFGAGIGELVVTLNNRGGMEIHGVDIMARPNGLPDQIIWHQQDLNEEFANNREFFDVVVCTEVIEHLENPRAVFRNLYRLLKPDGKLVLTMPNQENIRSFLTLIFRGQFASFMGPEYPAHITALLRVDLLRISQETGFSEPRFIYSGYGLMPKAWTTWQKASGNVLRGRLFSDNLGMIVTKLT
jgi:2-polyprenyl-3-methyl-5-hydroxy-6-metoxy-1,4-benzoquinol methylase